MEKQTITFSANEQCLQKTGGIDCYASNIVSYIEAQFELGDNWSGYDSVRAVWFTDFVSGISTVLDSLGTCIVPYEVLTRKGEVKVNLVGSIADGDVLTDRLTTCPVTAVVVKCNAKVTGANSTPITPSEYEQFVQNVKADADRAEAGATAAEQSAVNANASADEAEASAQNASESASASAISASDSARSATASAESAQNASESAQNAENAKDDAESARDKILSMRATASTLPAGSDATASYSDGLLTIGVPKGDTGATGAKGDKGDTGATPNFSIGTVETLEPTEDATATITGTAENPVLNLGIPKGEQGNVNLSQLESLLPTETASGSIVTITDGQSIVPAKSLKVALEPIQSGSGTPSPDNVRPISGRTEVMAIDDPMYGGYIEFNQLVGNNIRPSQTKNAVTFTNNGDGTFTMNGTADASDWWVTTPYPNNSLVAGHKYYIKETNHSGVADKYGIGWSVNPSTILLDDAIVTATSESSAITYIYKSGAVINNAVFKPMLFDLTQMFGEGNEPTTVEEFKALFPHDYYEYNEDEKTTVSAVNGNPYYRYTTSLGQTVYGGTLDVVSGELVVDRAMVTLDGTQSFVSQGNLTNTKHYSYDAPNMSNSPSTYSADVISDKMPTIADNSDTVHINHRNVGIHVWIPSDKTPSVWFAENPTTVVYPLATPQTIQLTPQEVQLLLGTNNVWSDGDVTLVYSADIQLWVEKKLS